MIIWEIHRGKILYHSSREYLKLSQPWIWRCQTIKLKILNKWHTCNRWRLCSSRWLRWTWMDKVQIQIRCSSCRHKCKTWCLWCSRWWISSLVWHKPKYQEHKDIHSNNSNNNWIKMHYLRRCNSSKHRCLHNSQKIACLISLTHKKSQLSSLQQTVTQIRPTHSEVVLEQINNQPSQATTIILLIFEKKRCLYICVTYLLPFL